MEFKKATLQEVSSQPSASPQPVGEAISVQINPSTLRLQLANTADFGKDVGRPKTQYQGSTSTLSFDLIFDTADEGTTEAPVDVRTRTRQLEQFMLPKKGTAKSVPPRVQFTYGTLTVVGVMSALNEEFDFFALNGVPLRAKCAVTIKEQKPEFDATIAGPGANTGAGARPPLPAAPGGVGAPGAPAPDRTAAALDGESASDFASRMGLDPSAWKDVVNANLGLLDPLRLEAGMLLDFASSASAGGALGTSASPTAGVAPAGAPTPPPEVPTPAQVPVEGGALTAAGGLSRALDRATAARVESAAGATRAAFAGVVSPLRRDDLPGAAARPAAVVTTDRRAASFGFGVPLRPRRGTTAAAEVVLVQTRDRRFRAASPAEVPVTDDPTVPRWEALPAVHHPSEPAHRSSCSCGCGSGKGH